jgi:hypothetical protein
VGGTNDGNFCATVGECPGGIACTRRKVITITGDNSAASAPDECFGAAEDTNDDPGWWEAFSIDSCAFVRIDHCCTDPIHEPAYRIMLNECNPCGPAIFSRPNPHDPLTQEPDQRGAPYCDKDNLWSWFGPLEAGTYWFPVYSAVSGHLGPYQVHFTVDACPEAACCTGTTCTPGINILDCEDPSGLNGIYLGPPNKSPAVTNCIPNNANICPTGFPNCCEVGGLTPGTGCGTCQTGSCCAPAATGPGTCDDQAGVLLMLQSDCNSAGGTFTGGVRCKGGTCSNNPARSCDEAANCTFEVACNGDARQIAQPSPCPLCEIAGVNNCHDMTPISVQFDISEFTLAELTVADEFIPFSNNISRLCTSGLYVSTVADADDPATGCRFRTFLPMEDPLDKFRISIYQDGADDGNGLTPAGLPGDLFAVRYASATGNAWQPAFPRVEGTSNRLVNLNGPNTALFGEDDLTDEDYQIDITDDPITGLVLDGRTYWLEIMNNMDESPVYEGEASCIWFINHSSSAEGNQFAAPGATGVFAGGAPFDLAWCIDQDFTEPDPPLAACCDCDGVCLDGQTLDQCTDSQSGWFLGNTCDDIEGTPDCPDGGGVPGNDNCPEAIDITTFGDPIATTVTIRTNHFCATTSLDEITVCTDFSPPENCESLCGDPDGDIVSQDLWYKYVTPADSDGEMLFNMCQTGTIWDSMFALYKGPDGTGVCPCPTDVGTCEAAAFEGDDGAMASDEGCANAAVGGAGITTRDLKSNTCYIFQVGAWGPTGSIPGLGFVSLHHTVGAAVPPLVPCENDFTANPTNGDRLPRFLCVDAPVPAAVAGGGAVVGEIKVTLKKLYNTSGGDPDGAAVCAPRPTGPTPPPLQSLSQFSGEVRYLGEPRRFADEVAPIAVADYIAAPLVCNAADAWNGDWSSAGLAAKFPGGSVDTTRIYMYGDTVVPCSVYVPVMCTDAGDAGSCNEDEAPTMLTARHGDCWPPFAPTVGQPSFTDINAVVQKYKSNAFNPATPAGGPPEWHALQAGNVVGNYPTAPTAGGDPNPLPTVKCGFLDIGSSVDGYKTIWYKPNGPCGHCTVNGASCTGLGSTCPAGGGTCAAVDTCGNACSLP